jgi:hypothetical protein
MFEPTMRVSPNERPNAEVAAATLKTAGTFVPLPSLLPEGVRPRQASANLGVRPIKPKKPERRLEVDHRGLAHETAPVTVRAKYLLVAELPRY